MKFLTFSCALLVLLSVACTQEFDEFDGFDTSSYGGEHFGGQDLSGFESGGFEGFSDHGGEFNLGQFGGSDVDQFAQFYKK